MKKIFIEGKSMSKKYNKFIDILTENRKTTVFFTIVGLFASVITIYSAFTSNANSRSEIVFRVISESKVLDVKQQVNNLEIFYENNSLSEEGKELRIVVVRVLNEGDGSLLLNHYDPNAPVGISVKDGVFAEKPIIINSSDEYLEEAVQFVYDGGSKVELTPFILDGGNYFDLQLLLMHGVDEIPEVNIFGKIAGYNDLVLLYNLPQEDDRTFLNIIFGGGFLANLVRVFAYGFAFLSLLILFVIIVEYFKSSVKKFKKKKEVEVFKTYNKVVFDEFEKKAVNMFLNNERGRSYVIQLSNALENKNIELVDEKNIFIKDADKDSVRERMNSLIGKEIIGLDVYRSVVDKELQYLFDHGVVSYKDTDFMVKEEYMNFIKKFANFLHEDN